MKLTSWIQPISIPRGSPLSWLLKGSQFHSTIYMFFSHTVPYPAHSNVHSIAPLTPIHRNRKPWDAEFCNPSLSHKSLYSLLPACAHSTPFLQMKPSLTLISSAFFKQDFIASLEQYSMVNKSMDFKIQGKTGLNSSPAIRPWVSHLSFLSSFFISKNVGNDYLLGLFSTWHTSIQ